MKEKIGKAWNWFFSSLDNHSDGASGRKITAMVMVGLVCHGHLKYVDKSNFYNVLIVYVIFVCVLLGIVTIEQIIKMFAIKNGQTVKEETTTTTKEETKTTVNE
jgi:hypothetical protein